MIDLLSIIITGAFTLYGAHRLAGDAYAAVTRWAVQRAAAASPEVDGIVATSYRYCPTELRTRAAVLHADGSAACLDCGAHIPAPEVDRA